VKALACLLLLAACVPICRAQAPDGTMTAAEIDTLRDAAAQPLDRVAAYEKMLNTRDKRMTELLAKRRSVEFAGEMHDLMDQFAAITDELNDNLDEYSAHHRDVRKVLPKLVQAVERWSTTLRTPPDNDRYNVVRRLALEALKETRTLAETLQAEQDAYFLAHPDAAKAEKQRREDPHAPMP